VLEAYEKDGINCLAMYCACAMVPVLAAYTFCAEKYPEDLELTKRIENVKIFYGISTIEE
jgi:cytochrome c biogenesis protein CcdA